MPIKWSPLMLSEARDMVEEYVNQAVEPIEQVRIVARQARNIPNLPQYVDQYLVRIIGEIDRAIGGSQWEPDGRLKAGIPAPLKLRNTHNIGNLNSLAHYSLYILSAF